MPTDQPSDWPSLVAVRRYVEEVRNRIDEGLDSALVDARAREFSPDLLLNVAIEHRLMHAETLAYMLHQLPLDRKVQKQRDTEPVAPAIKAEMIEIPAGKVTVGLRRDSAEFGWDNEYEQHVVQVAAFAIDKYKVSNRQYMGFVAAGGYQERSLWREEAWKWIGESGITHPSFWRQQNGFWLLRTMFDEIPLPLEWPVYVSQAEAAAYARWAKKSLPSEAEWQRAAWASAEGQDPTSRRGGEKWGTQRTEPAVSGVRVLREGNFNFRRWDPSPVGADPAAPSSFGVRGMIGNGWEWTSTSFGPFPGFEPFPFYRGYSAAFFDNKHYVIKGGSARTAACMLRPSFRNWFQPHYPYVYAGFRCVKN